MIKRKASAVLRRLMLFARRLKFYALSTNTWNGFAPTRHQPLLLSGSGTITFHKNVKFGVASSPSFWSSECYIEARLECAKIEIGQNTWINNGFSAISENGAIFIGEDCLIGHDVFIVDSDFHQLEPEMRHSGARSISRPVHIGNDVFIGSRATILKNSHIGDGCVVAAGAVVSGTFPARSLISGNPAKLIRTL